MIDRKQFLSGLCALGAAPLFPRVAFAQDAKPSGLTAEVADFIVSTRFSDLPPALIELSKKHVLDCMGLALAGEMAETGPLVRKYVASLGTGKATVLGTALSAQPRFAAFANGVAIHADDYDDTQLAVGKDRAYGLLTHPSVTALPASLAMAEALGKSGRDFMLAYHLGVEVETKIAEASDPRAYNTGFHSTGLFGVFGAATGAAKVRGLDAKGVRCALGLAGAQASGLRENFGTMTKPFQAGHGAEGGVVAADLAALGWTAAENILEAPNGLYHAAAGSFDAASISGKLGKPWSFMTPGVSIKPYPSGSLSHPALDEMSRLVKANDLKPEQIELIRVGGNKAMLNALFRHRPTSGLEGKFSMEYLMAVLVVDRKAGLGQFTDAAVNRPAVQALLRKVEYYDNPASDAAGADKMHSIIEIKLKDGRTIQGNPVDYARGSPQVPMTFDDVVEKFRDCAGYAGLSGQQAERIIAAVRGIDGLADIGQLTRLMVKG